MENIYPKLLQNNLLGIIRHLAKNEDSADYAHYLLCTMGLYQ